MQSNLAINQMAACGISTRHESSLPSWRSWIRFQRRDHETIRVVSRLKLRLPPTTKRSFPKAGIPNPSDWERGGKSSTKAIPRMADGADGADSGGLYPRPSALSAVSFFKWVSILVYGPRSQTEETV